MSRSPFSSTMPPHKANHGPIFPYRFSFGLCCTLHSGEKPIDGIPWGHTLCRWALSSPDRALEWNEQGKGKGVTLLWTDGPKRCCSDLIPQLVLVTRIPEDLERLLPGPGKIYRAYIAGDGWYAADRGSEFFVRLVTNKEDVPQLRAEAMILDREPPGIRREPLRQRRQNSEDRMAFHGFYETDGRDAAAIVFAVCGPLPEEDDFAEEMGKKPRKKKGKKKRHDATVTDTL